MLSSNINRHSLTAYTIGSNPKGSNKFVSFSSWLLVKTTVYWMRMRLNMYSISIWNKSGSENSFSYVYCQNAYCTQCLVSSDTIQHIAQLHCAVQSNLHTSKCTCSFEIWVCSVHLYKIPSATFFRQSMTMLKNFLKFVNCKRFWQLFFS